MTDVRPEDVIRFWMDDVGPEGWFAATEAMDAQIRDRFMAAWKAAAAGELDCWSLRPEGALALVILLDQFPRNMFRGSEAAYSSDRKALATAKQALSHGFDIQVSEAERFMFYLPLMHSESITDQDRCVRLIMTRMPKTGALPLKHAREHRDVIRRFGRFPRRNEPLGRSSTDAEQNWMADEAHAA